LPVGEPQHLVGILVDNLKLKEAIIWSKSQLLSAWRPSGFRTPESSEWKKLSLAVLIAKA